MNEESNKNLAPDFTPRPSAGEDKACPLCASGARFFLNADQREYWLCPQCGLIFVPPEFFISAQDEIHRYRQHNNSLDNPGYVDMFQKKIEIVKRHCSGARSVLDFGCGPEPVLKVLLEREGYRADAYDPNFFPDGISEKAYDLILSTETFEHLKEPKREFEKLYGLLAPGGWLAIMTRFYPQSDDQNDFASWYYKRDPTHIVFYGPETFRWAARRWGFEIVYLDQKDFVLLRRRRGAGAR